MSKMKKHQAISLKLAQWLGRGSVHLSHDNSRVLFFQNEGDKMFIGEFNPITNSTEGRAQFAECVIKAGLEKDIGADLLRNAVRSGWDEKLHRVNHDNTPEGITAATLEAIYYAIGGTAGELEE